MKKFTVIFTLSSLLTLGFAAQSQAQVVVVKPKAPVVVVKKGPRPSRHHVWVGGHYTWNARRGKYVWVNGCWTRPRRGKVWVGGRWKRTRGGYVYVPGRWA